MLILSRRVGESIMIGHDIVITVLDLRGDAIRIGIQAPRDVQVHREEVYAAVMAANRAAASPSEDTLAKLAAGLPKIAGNTESDGSLKP